MSLPIQWTIIQQPKRTEREVLMSHPSPRWFAWQSSTTAHIVWSGLWNWRKKNQSRERGLWGKHEHSTEEWACGLEADDGEFSNGCGVQGSSATSRLQVPRREYRLDTNGIGRRGRPISSPLSSLDLSQSSFLWDSILGLNFWGFVRGELLLFVLC